MNLIVLLVVVGVSHIYADDDVTALNYLAKYGYLKIGRSGTSGSSNVADALRKFQRYAGLNETGVADNGTIFEMNIPRCGMKDNSKYNPLISKWSITHLKYRLLTFSGDLSMDNIRRIIREAFDMWSAVTPLTFELTNHNDEDIQIGFYYGSHPGDSDAFDGKGGVLAHAAYPPSGDIHFDDAETFSDKRAKHINLLWVAAHEIGHALGLEHSPDRDAIMYAIYGGYEPNLTLRSDDIWRIQNAYGSKNGGGIGPKPTGNSYTHPPPPATRGPYSWIVTGWRPTRAPTTYRPATQGQRTWVVTFKKQPQATTRRPVTRRPSNCVDSWDNCHYRRSIGECQYPSIKRLCRLTCNEC